MDMTIEKMEGFQVIGFERIVSYDDAYEVIPKLWDEFAGQYMIPLFAKDAPETDIERAICTHMIGEYGVCVTGTAGTFRYLIAGRYQGGEVPEGMSLCDIPALEWAKFRCLGPMPGALQAVNTKIFQEWLPENETYEIAADMDIEWYSQGDTTAADYESGIWVPVRKKQ